MFFFVCVPKCKICQNGVPSSLVFQMHRSWNLALQAWKLARQKFHVIHGYSYISVFIYCLSYDPLPSSPVIDSSSKLPNRYKRPLTAISHHHGDKSLSFRFNCALSPLFALVKYLLLWRLSCNLHVFQIHFPRLLTPSKGCGHFQQSGALILSE